LNEFSYLKNGTTGARILIRQPARSVFKGLIAPVIWTKKFGRRVKHIATKQLRPGLEKNFP
jgi:hypothetical protein